MTMIAAKSTLRALVRVSLLGAVGLTVLKLLGVLTVPWVVLLAPVWLPWGAAAFVLLVYAIVHAVLTWLEGDDSAGPPR